MRTPDYTGQFKRDFRKLESRGKDMAKMEEAMFLLLTEAPLPERYKDHALKGSWRHYRELHIAPDWLLVYKIIGDIVLFARTGTHADIFSL
jgi:mRNA interferase YafQ